MGQLVRRKSSWKHLKIATGNLLWVPAKNCGYCEIFPVQLKWNNKKKRLKKRQYQISSVI